MPRVRCPAIVVALAVLAGSAPARAQTPELVIPTLDGREVRVDGVLDEPVWAETSLVIDTFWKFLPVDEGPADVPTEVRIFQDEVAIYFGWRCTLPAGDRVRAHLAAREDVDRDDQVGMYLDTFEDHRRGFVFYVNALGVQQDIRVGDDVGYGFEWDTRFSSAGRLTDDGYVVEVVIPFSALRFPRGDEHRFGLVLTRRLAQRNSKIVFPEVKQGGSLFAQAATLTGIHGAQPGRPLEIIPSVVFGHGWERDGTTGEMVDARPLGLDSLHQGATFRWGLTPNVSLGMALNPDFSQVESDPDLLDVNTRYALSLEEKRPFFLEGLDVFRTPYNRLYTRSIGKPAEGLNLNGVENGWTVGVLHAIDQAPSPSVVAEAVTPGFGAQDVDGAVAVNNILRVKRDLGRHGAVGVYLADKEIGRDPAAGPTGSHQVGSADAYVRLGRILKLTGQGAYSTTAEVGGERIHGGAYAIDATVEDGRGSVWFEHQNTGRGFRNETAFLTRADQIAFDLGGDYRLETGKRFLTELYWGAEGEVSWMHNRSFDGHELDGWLRFKFGNLSYLSTWAGQFHEVYAGQRFDGGWAMARLSSGELDAVRWYAEIGGGSEVNYDPDDLFQGRAWEVSAGAYVRLFRRLTLDISGVHHAMRRVDGEPHYDAQLLRTVALLSFTRDLWLRAVFQLNSYDRDLDLELLLGWTPHPGTALYLGYSEGAAWDASPLQTRQRALFLKGQVLFRP